MIKKHTNRHGITYHWDPIDDNHYLFVIDSENSIFRFGCKPDQESVDVNDLEFFDPSGGPFVSIGSQVEGREVIHIESCKEGYVVEVKIK